MAIKEHGFLGTQLTFLTVKCQSKNKLFLHAEGVRYISTGTIIQHIFGYFMVSKDFRLTFVGFISFVETETENLVFNP